MHLSVKDTIPNYRSLHSSHLYLPILVNGKSNPRRYQTHCAALIALQVAIFLLYLHIYCPFSLRNISREEDYILTTWSPSIGTYLNIIITAVWNQYMNFKETQTFIIDRKGLVDLNMYFVLLLIWLHLEGMLCLVDGHTCG